MNVHVPGNLPVENKNHKTVYVLMWVTAENERTTFGFTSWSGAAVVARDRAAWRRRIYGPIPQGGCEKKVIIIYRFRLA